MVDKAIVIAYGGSLVDRSSTNFWSFEGLVEILQEVLSRTSWRGCLGLLG